MSTHKKPGRPKKKNGYIVAKQGVRATPVCADNMLEVEIDRVLLMKKLGSFVDDMKTQKLLMVFTKQEMIMFCQGYDETTNMKVSFDASVLATYYFPVDEKEISLVIPFSTFSIILERLDSTFASILFILTKEKRTSQICVNLKLDATLSETYEIASEAETNEYKAYINTFNTALVAAPAEVEFSLNSEYFRKLIKGSKEFRNILLCEKTKTSALTITWETESKKLSGVIQLDNKEQEIKYNNTPDVFSYEISSKNIKAVNADFISGKIIFKLNTDKPMYMFSFIEGKAVSVILCIKPKKT